MTSNGSETTALSIGGVPAQAIADEFGTPVYVYDAAKIEAQFERLTSAFAGFRHELHYALKANNNLNVLRVLKRLGAGLDAVSIQEVQLGLHAGFGPERILYTPNGVSWAEFEKAVALGVRLNIDNLALLEQFGAAYGNTKAVCIRLNPHIFAGGHRNISVGHIDSKFGISIFQLPHVLRLVRTYNLRVDGLHMHTGSDILDAEVFLRGADVLFQAAQEFEHLQYLDFGSGFKVAYRPDDPATDVEQLGKRLADRLKDFHTEYGRELSIWFEPGKFLVSEAGYFLVRVNTIKQTTSTVFAAVDSGLNHLLRPMLYDAYHGIVNVTNPAGATRVYNVVGYICETDTFATDRRLPEVREGDILAFQNAGAYCFSMASNYNSRFRPAEVLVLDGRAHLIRQREELNDLLARQVAVPALETPSLSAGARLLSGEQQAVQEEV